MDRSRSKRSYYDQDFDSDNLPRTKQRYNPHNNYHHAPQSNHHRRFVSSCAGNSGGGRKVQDPSFMVTTTYRILCHDVKVGGVIGKSGSIIKSIRQHTGAWINVHELVQGDEERIIEISDTRRRDPDGRMPAFSPAQEALFLVHQRILESDVEFGGEDGDEYGGRGGGGANRVVTRLVVSRIHVGSLLGKGGKIIEQMRNETKTHIRVLPRDNNLPRCVAMSEEIVQVTGEMNNVKNALGIISSRLRESQHRDRNHFHGRLHSPEHAFPPSDDFITPLNDLGCRASVDGSRLSRSFNTSRGYSSNSSRPSGYAIESGGPSFTDNNEQLITSEILVFRIICPIYKVDAIIGEPDGILDLLQNDIGVDVEITDPVAGFNEQIIIISSVEGPDDELFPAQEALLHIQTAIVDLVPEKENVVTTRLVVQSDEVGCLRGVSEMQKMNGAVVQILPKEELSSCLSETDVIVQIVGEIRAAREALIEVTSRLRSYIYRELFLKETSPLSPPSPVGSVSGAETASANNYSSLSQETRVLTDPAASVLQNGSNIPIPHPLKDVGVPVGETSNQNVGERLKDMPSALNRIHVPLVTRSTLEVVIPPHAAPKLITKSRNKLAQISELSGATVKLIEDRTEETEKIIQISGTPDQAERAQSLLQGFILSTQEDGP